ncbi:class II fructose-bisphosphate aldolase [Planomonospora venezuelensis]|uniref:Fructose-bisphosphate aldolase class II n=1 Tax=Planomonospora venezuelensis TaxID=1999 RepID=A0A841D4P3_PLAVE|nr:class II fructose-bisphosphate aldolase [Planomonospora venezuelensis]MBB5963933.1 fructose-bisphosphate aldolase class II [Planomonospora venezuelensis]GIN03881.1 fructose-bisphosphate aldolase [Planomonospora venezuelensis]
MPVVGIGEIVSGAPAGVGAFNVVQLEHAEAIVAGAEAAGAPVVLQISENCVRYHGALAPVAAASLAVARASSTAVAVHLDHATDRALVEEAVELGLGSVMFDASALPDEENAALTAEVAAWCHARGVWVEAELGEIGGKDGVHAPGARTRPHEAVDYVARTGVDALAVAVGSSHAMTTRDAVLDLALIAELHAAVPVPLVLHGSSGVPDETLRAAVRHGMKKINIATHLNRAFTGAIREHLAADEKAVDSRTYMKAARTAVAAEVARLLGVLAG